MRKLTCAILALFFSVNLALAEDLSTKQILRKNIEATKEDLRQQRLQKEENIKKQSPTYKKAEELKLKQSNEVELIDKQIKAKKEEIATIKRMRISEREQKLRLKPLESQLQQLKLKRERTFNFYQKQIDLIKLK